MPMQKDGMFINRSYSVKICSSYSSAATMAVGGIFFAIIYALVLSNSFGSTVKESKLPLIVSTWGNKDFQAAAQKSLDRIRASPTHRLLALVEGLSECENRQCDTTVGFGGSPDENGETTLDAMIIDGVGQKMGAVADLREIKEAAAVAWSVMNHTKHSYIVGNQATEFAIQMGFKKHSLKTELSTKMHKDWLHGNCQPNFWKNVSPDPRHSCGPYKPLPQITPTEDTDRSFSQNSHDTIGMIIIDKNKDCAVGTSTNGARNKIAGRVGDSSIVGAGAYVDNLVGGASATGDGDIMMRFLPSFLAVEKMRSGSSPQKAAEIAIMRIKEYYPNFFGAVIAGNIKGEHGAACNGMPIFQYTAANGGETNVKVYDVKCF